MIPAAATPTAPRLPRTMPAIAPPESALPSFFVSRLSPTNVGFLGVGDGGFGVGGVHVGGFWVGGFGVGAGAGFGMLMQSSGGFLPSANVKPGSSDQDDALDVGSQTWHNDV